MSLCRKQVHLSVYGLLLWSLAFAASTPAVVAQDPGSHTEQQQQQQPRRTCLFRWQFGNDEPLADLQKALSYHRQHGGRSAEGVTLNAIGNVYLALDQYDDALSVFNQSVSLGQAIGELGLEAGSLSGLGHAYLGLGQYRQATQFFEQSWQKRRALNSPYMEGLALNNLGNVAYAAGHDEQALKFYEQGLDKVANDGNSWLNAAIMGNLGNVYLSMKAPTKASEQYHKALATAYLDAPNRGALLSNLALAAAASGQTSEASQLSTQALGLLFPSKNHDCIWRALSNQGKLLAQQGRSDTAIYYYKQATTRIEATRKSLQRLPLEQQLSYVSTIRYVYEELAALQQRQGKPAEAKQVLDSLSLPSK